MHALNLCVSLDLDASGSPYLNANVAPSFVVPYQRMLAPLIGVQKFELYTAHQQRRDAGRHHITVVNPLEYPSCDSQMIAGVLGYPIHVHMLGIGHVQEGSNEVFFIVCECPELMRVRQMLKLKHADFHITLGFAKSDIFDQPKDRTALITPFAQLDGNHKYDM